MSKLWTVPTVLGITVTHMFQFFQFSSKVQLFLYFLPFFYFPSVVCWDGKIHKMVGIPGLFCEEGVFPFFFFFFFL